MPADFRRPPFPGPRAGGIPRSLRREGVFRPEETEETWKFPEKVVLIVETQQKKVMLSGIQPSGDLTLGSYLGAIKNWVERTDESVSYTHLDVYKRQA